MLLCRLTLRGLGESVGRRIGSELLRRVVGVTRRLLAVGLALAGLTTPATAAATSTTTTAIAISVTTIIRRPALAVGACTFTVGCLAVLSIARLSIAHLSISGRLIMAIFGRAVRSAVVGGKFLTASPGSPVRAFAFGAIAPATAATPTAATAAFAFLVGRAAFTALAGFTKFTRFAGVAVLDIVRLVANRCLA